MSNPIERMKRKRQREPKLDGHLGRQRQGSERGSQRRGFQVPAEEWRDQVADTEEVEGTGEDGARDAVQSRDVPGDLRLVDGEVRGDGPVEPLFDDEGFCGGGVGGGRFGDGGCVCCRGSGWSGSGGASG